MKGSIGSILLLIVLAVVALLVVYNWQGGIEPSAVIKKDTPQQTIDKFKNDLNEVQDQMNKRYEDQLDP